MLKPSVIEYRYVADFKGMFQADIKKRAGAIITIRSSVPDRHAGRIAALATKNRLPSMAERNEFVEAGGLMSYASNETDLCRRHRRRLRRQDPEERRALGSSFHTYG